MGKATFFIGTSPFSLENHHFSWVYQRLHLKAWDFRSYLQLTWRLRDFPTETSSAAMGFESVDEFGSTRVVELKTSAHDMNRCIVLKNSISINVKAGKVGRSHHLNLFTFFFFLELDTSPS